MMWDPRVWGTVRLFNIKCPICGTDKVGHWPSEISENEYFSCCRKCDYSWFHPIKKDEEE